MGVIGGDFVRRPYPSLPRDDPSQRMQLGDRESKERMSDRETWLHETNYLKSDDGDELFDDDSEFRI